METQTEEKHEGPTKVGVYRQPVAKKETKEAETQARPVRKNEAFTKMVEIRKANPGMSMKDAWARAKQ